MSKEYFEEKDSFLERQKAQDDPTLYREDIPHFGDICIHTEYYEFVF